MKFTFIKKGFLTLLGASVVVMTLNYFLMPRHLENYYSHSSLETTRYFTESDQPNYNKSGLNPSASSTVLPDTEIVTEKAPIITKCGFKHCTKAKTGRVINIHLVPHSHLDPGYKKTMDEYFYGRRNDIHNVSIPKIIDNVIHQLTINQERKFVYVEIVFFKKWWQIQDESVRETVRELVRNGRLEFLNGGWCINDEATTNYADIIDQMSLGLNFLNETFGECGRPKVAVQFDTFGHSREYARLSTLMGFDALFVGRASGAENKISTIDGDSQREMIWFGSDLPGKHPSIFTGVTYNNFDPFPGFCFENVCGNSPPKPNTPVNDDLNSKGYNVDKKIDDFLSESTEQAFFYRTNNIMIFMGSDFTYQNAEVWFTNMDKLIRYVNRRQKDGSPFNIFYSTPTCYVKAVNEANVTWATMKDDFFPYKTDNYWAGYLSSRPALKYMVRQGSSLLQACKQMASVLKLKGEKDEGDLSVMKEAMAVLQHHDGVTGTHSQRVSEDYKRILHNGAHECTKTINSYYQAVLPRNKELGEFKFSVSYCYQLNMSQCEVTEQKGGNIVVNIYNPLGQYITKYVRVPVNQEFYNKFRVIDSNGTIIQSQLMPIASFVASIPERNSSATHELIFLATQVPPLGSKSYFIEVSFESDPLSIPIQPNSTTDSIEISNNKLSLAVTKETGVVTSVTILGKNKTIPLDQQFYWYNGNRGHNSTRPGSGVYVFNPLNNSALPIKMKTKNVTVYKGDLVEEIHQTVNDYVSQIIRLYKEVDYIEFDWVIGPIPIEDGVGKEIVTRYTTDFKNNGTFYTDSNGRQNVLRTQSESQSDPIASNYYPITSHVFMTDSKSGYRMNLLTDRAQGGGSVEDGQLELLVHRRFVQEDLGMFKEPLDEMVDGKGVVVRGTHTLFFEDSKDEKKLGSPTLRSLVQERSGQPVISFISMNHTFDEWIKFHQPKLQLLSQPLPENVKLLTFEPRHGYEGEYLLRLEHIYDVDEHILHSRPAEVSLKGLFEGFSIEEIKETTLDGSLMKSDLKKLSWRSADEDIDANLEYNTSSASVDRIKLMPMEIRTFIIKLLPK